MPRHLSRPARIVVSIAALILFWQLILPPVVGVANNGDFGKLLDRFRLGGPNEFQYISTRYVVDQRNHFQSGYWSSELVLIWPMLQINTVISKDGSFDLRLMGVIQGSLFLLAIALFVPLLAGLNRSMRMAICAAVLFMFCDFAYVGYFNSFYMDVSAYLFLVLAVVVYLRVVRWRRRSDSIMLVICCALVIASKAQHAILSVWFAVLFWAARDILWSARRAAAGVVPVALLLGGWVVFRSSAPADYTAKNEFNVIFFQILPHARDVDGALRELRLDDSYRMWIGTHAYSQGSRLEDPAFYVPFLQRVSYGRIALFYLKHPTDAYRALRTSLDEAGRYRMPMGNFDVGSGQPPLAESRSFCGWSDLKRHLYHHHGARLLFSFLGLASLVAALLGANRGNLPTGAVVGGIVFILMAVTEMVVSALGDVFDPTRHQLLFFAQFDLLLLAAIWLANRSWALRRLRHS